MPLMQIPLLANLKKPVPLLVCIGTFLLFFDISYYLMATTSGVRDYMCVIGANLTLSNIIFSLIIGLLVGIVMSGLLTFLLSVKSKRKIMTSSFSGIGAALGGLTIFCLPCALPVVSLFGFSVSLQFFTSHNIFLKIVSFVLLLCAGFLLNKKLAIECERCVG